MIVIRNLRASRVNLLQNDMVAGLPSPFAFLGLAASMAPELDVERWSLGVLPIIHEIHVSEGRTKAQPENKGGRYTPTEIPEDLHGTVRFSLLIDDDGDADPNDVRRAIATRKLAGGLLFAEPGAEIKVDEIAADGSAFRQIRRGRAVIPVAGLPTARGRNGELSALADALFPEDRTTSQGWLVPVAAGYALLEDPATAPKRSGVRDPDLPHVFAEPVAGLAALKSPRNRDLVDLTEKELRDMMWRYATRPGHIAAHRFYLPA